MSFQVWVFQLSIKDSPLKMYQNQPLMYP